VSDFLQYVATTIKVRGDGRIVIDNGQEFRERLAAALNSVERVNAQDNPELDDTPFESAAYTRGRDAGFNAAVPEVNKILDGKDSGTGVCSAEWQPTRERLLTQAGAVEEARATLAHVASIAHEGGLGGYDELDALCDIRRLTLAHWIKTGTHAEALKRLYTAIDAARSKE
jgi:hypothetical protein